MQVALQDLKESNRVEELPNVLWALQTLQVECRWEREWRAGRGGIGDLFDGETSAEFEVSTGCEHWERNGI